jgi:uncharacterized protein involved in outer membrane biogenesis
LPLIALDRPQVTLLQHADGASNYALQLSGSSSGKDSTNDAQSGDAKNNEDATQIGDLRINDGQIAAKLAKLRTDMVIGVSTQGDGDQAQIVATAKGTYAAAPITGKLTGGALLSLRDAASPWPVDMLVENGATRVALAGTLQDQLHLKGAKLKLQFSGQDMGQLEPLTGVPIPKTPPYRITGNLDFANRRIQFQNFEGRVGSSDLEGTFDYDPSKARPELIADLRSRKIDLTDLAGFIGTEPGHADAAGKTAAQRQAIAKAEARPKLFPDKPISMPRLTWADIHLKYHGQQILGRSVPLDNVTVVLDIDDGTVQLHPISFAVGQGRINGTVVLTPQQNKLLRAKADIEVQRVDVTRLMSATHTFNGAGTISGTGSLDTVGNSFATMMGNGNGGLRLGMVGGDLSALLIDISGLQFGNALLSALGIPQRAQVQCLVNDMALQKGVLNVKALVLDTDEGIVNGTGNVNLRDETIDLSLKTETKHFTIGSLPTPINISGTLRNPSIRPGAELAVRGGLAAGLAVAFPPLALLPTIQFGVGDDHRCDHLLSQAKTEANGARLPTPKGQQAR